MIFVRPTIEHGGTYRDTYIEFYMGSVTSVVCVLLFRVHYCGGCNIILSYLDKLLSTNPDNSCSGMTEEREPLYVKKINYVIQTMS